MAASVQNRGESFGRASNVEWHNGTVKTIGEPATLDVGPEFLQKCLGPVDVEQVGLMEPCRSEPGRQS